MRFCVSACLVLLLHSCASLDLWRRAGKDEKLTTARSSLLQGTYGFTAGKATPYNNALCAFAGRDSIDHSLNIVVTPEGSRRVRIHRTDGHNGDSLNLLLKGRYRKGYFITRSKWSAVFPAGPLLWGLDISRLALGITREGQMVLVYTSGGILFIIAMPVSGSNADVETFYVKTQ